MMCRTLFALHPTQQITALHRKKNEEKFVGRRAKRTQSRDYVYVDEEHFFPLLGNKNKETRSIDTTIYLLHRLRIGSAHVSLTRRRGITD